MSERHKGALSQRVMGFIARAHAQHAIGFMQLRYPRVMFSMLRRGYACLGMICGYQPSCATINSILKRIF
jgi:hypothetical protein